MPTNYPPKVYVWFDSQADFGATIGGWRAHPVDDPRTHEAARTRDGVIAKMRTTLGRSFDVVNTDPSGRPYAL